MRKPLVLAIVAAFFLASGEARAHAFLDHAIPAVGATVAPPAEISVWFTQKIEPAFSAMEVTDAAGRRVDKADSRVDPATPTLLHVSLKPLTAGIYRVHWHVVSVDTHRTQGDFTFTVAP